jgi:hypothetical protein
MLRRRVGRHALRLLKLLLLLLQPLLPGAEVDSVPSTIGQRRQDLHPRGRLLLRLQLRCRLVVVGDLWLGLGQLWSRVVVLLLLRRDLRRRREMLLLLLLLLLLRVFVEKAGSRERWIKAVLGKDGHVVVGRGLLLLLRRLLLLLLLLLLLRLLLLRLLLLRLMIRRWSCDSVDVGCHLNERSARPQ